ncbi:hypothetical protein [Actinoplanes sp. NBRC 103695]|uniref:hypothetical protein n=1 Tax=Actinoplanes sp. NBRC 103695 TaxID=3032202 RepID=UPI0024A5D5F2|nr:hypothetical protein [Actinoplanes sp. NBRC 103695]GLY99885.1 hypothetical protein Acsp02_71380 [Actinoplanes sp. NBRC 103695]
METLAFVGPAVGLVALGVTILFNLRPAARERKVKSSQAEFIHQRQQMNASRLRLSQRAAEIHLGADKNLFRVAGTTLLAEKRWLVESPVKLTDIECRWDSDDAGTDPAIADLTRHVLPFRAPGKRFDSYSSAMAALCPPGIFRNQPSYRMTAFDLTADPPWVTFGMCQYFDMIDVSEALAHEMSVEVGQKFRLRSEFLRDALAMDRRVVLPSIGTLTIVRRRAADPIIFLHERSGIALAIATDLYQVIPAGAFQPASRMPQGYLEDDLNLWRNVMREFAEELLGEDEYSGAKSGRPIDYDQGLFGRLEQGIQDDKLSVYCFGFGLDPLTLTADWLTVAVFDEEFFSTAFPDVVEENSEGGVIKNIPFTQSTVERLGHTLAPSGAACLALAWENRELLLGSALNDRGLEP